MSCETHKSTNLTHHSLAKTGRQKGGQDLSQGVDELMRNVLRARTQMEHRKNLGAGVDGQPEPEHVCGAAQPGVEFIQLQMREVQVAEIVLVQRLSMLPSPREPGRDGRFSKAEDPLGSRRVEPFGQRREHHGDVMRGGFQTIQRSIASSTKRGVAGRASKGLDLLGTTVLAIADKSMDVSIGDSEV
jgi:hypothetical protein